MTTENQTSNLTIDDEEDRELRTKEDIAWRIRKTSYKEGQADMLADLFGGDIDNDPLAFMIACNIRYIGDMNKCYNIAPTETEDLINFYKEKYPKATARAFALRPMSGDVFYAKYGIKEIWERWEIVNERSSLEIWDLFDLENPIHGRMIIECGNNLKDKILWSMAGDWLNDLLEYSMYAITPNEVGEILGDY